MDRARSLTLLILLSGLIAGFHSTAVLGEAPKAKEALLDPREAISLDTLTEEVLRNNKAIEVFSSEVTKTAAEMIVARTWDNPELIVGPASKRLSASDDSPSERFFKGTFQLNQLILFPGKRALQIATVETDTRISELALSALKNQLRFKAYGAFHELLAAEKLVTVREEQIRSAEVFADSTLKKVKAGYGSHLEQIRGETEVITAKKLLRTAQGRLKMAQVMVNGLRGRDLSACVGAAGQDKTVPLVPGKPELLALAYQANPAIKTQIMLAEKAGLNVRSAELSRMPDLTIGPFVEQGRDEQVYGVELSLPLPLWDRKSGAIGVAMAEQKKATTGLEKLKTEIAESVITMHEKLLVSFDQAKLYTPAFFKMLEQGKTEAEQSYATGGTNVLAYLDARRTYYDTKADYYETIAALHNAYADLQAAVGVPLTNDTLR